jgi:uncharacterized protein (DUF433 family)
VSRDVGHGLRVRVFAGRRWYRLDVETRDPHPPDPRETPAYTVAEAAGLVRVPVSTLKTWIHGEGSASRGLLVLPASRPRLLAFSHLVEAFVLAAIRRGHGVALQRVRRAMRFVQRELAVERPLIHAKFKTDGVDLFVEHWGKLVNASRDGQLSMRGALETSLRRVDWDRQGLAVRLFPLVRASGTDQPKTIVIDPARGFGRPTLSGKGIRVDVIVERYRAGETIAELADDYRVAPELIDDAVRCELRAAG